MALPAETDETKAMMRRATWAAVSVASGLIVLKMVAWISTGSVSLLSSLLDSMLDLIASGMNLLAVHYALVPPDAHHRFGHGKLESLAGLGQAAFIGGSALFLIMESSHRLVAPRMVERGEIGIVVMVISIIATFALVRYQRKVVEKSGSVAIDADSLHYSGDVLINGSVIISLLLSMTVGWTFVDPIFAIGIALFLLWNAWKILSSSFNYLMDRELSEEQREKIIALATQQDKVLGFHELRTRSSGTREFIQLHLELEDDLPLIEAHAIALSVEEAIQKEFPAAEIIIHEDPASLRPIEIKRGEVI